MAPRRLHRFAALLVLALALGAAVDAQGPSDTGNSPPGTPTTPPPGVPAVTPVTPPAGNAPTTPPPNGQPQPTPSTKKPVAGADTGSSSGGSDVPSKTPAPSRTTKAPVVAPVTPGVTPATPAPPITQTPAEILVDRQAKSEYGTRPPSAATDTSTSTSTSKSEASKMGSWLAPAIIGAVIISALIVMTFFVRSHRSGGNADEDFTTPQRRGSDNFHELPKSTTHHVNVPVLGDPVKDKVAAEQNHMRAAGMNGVLHSPRANRVASSPPLMAEPNRAPSPGFGAYKQ